MLAADVPAEVGAPAIVEPEVAPKITYVEVTTEEEEKPKPRFIRFGYRTPGFEVKEKDGVKVFIDGPV